MKTIQILILFISTIILAYSCKKETELIKPTIDFQELGYNNSAEAFTGSDLHMEAEIVANEKIKTISIEIHPEFAGNWEFDTIYTEFSGLKNTTFHKHIQIPTHADTGDYHFHFIVTDMEGQQTEFEAELKLKITLDQSAPTISIYNAPITNQLYKTGDTLRIKGKVEDNIGLGGLYIGLVKTSENLNDSLVDATNTITIFHGHNFTSPTSHEFNHYIIVNAPTDNNSPAKDLTLGNWWQSEQYYILVKCKDMSSNWAFSQHIPFVLNL